MDSDLGGKTRYVVADAADLPPGQRKIVEIARREIGIFNINGNFHALRNLCPHKGGPLCRGRLRPLVVASDVYRVDHQQEGEILKCPWHQWEFDIKTGRALCDETLRVRTYPVFLEGDKIVLYLAPRP
jgi:3-phenylpropionate/trans-cinnamate dioxygenase ferredoxin subunit